MLQSEVSEPRGVLNRKAGETSSRHFRLAPSREVGYFVEHYWIVCWDLRGQESVTAATLPHPSVHVVIEENHAEVLGVMTGKFERLIQGRGRVFGIKFRPGAFYPFLQLPLSRLTNRSLSLRAVFGAGSTAFAKAIRHEPSERSCVRLAETFLKARLPDPDPSLELARGAVESTCKDPAITQVEQIASAAQVSVRALQRLFSTYVGVTPKWVIKRYRLHEAAEQLASGKFVTMSDLALRLGYFDQAHFIRDFKATVGSSPGEYLKRLGNARRAGP